jgi:PAS domain S-box-containing protein
MPKNHDSKTDLNDILIVDDEIPNLKLLTQLLSEAGYQVRPAKRPQMAIESALARPPSLILLDVRMPEMDGFEVCRCLKQEELTRDIPVIFVSALQDVKDRIRGFEAGGVDFISKPFQESEVLARVRTHMELRNMQLNLEEIISKRTAELSESESRFRATFEQAAVGIAHVSPEGRFLRVNQKWCDIVGYSHEEMIKLTFQDITHPDDLDTDLDYVRQVLDGEIETYSMEKRYFRKSGEIVWINLTVSLVRNEAGQPQWFVSVIKDISDRKQAETALHEREATLSTLLNAPLEVIMLVNREGTVLSTNKGGASRFGKSTEEMIGHNIFQSMPGEVAQLRKHYGEEVFKTGKSIHFEDEREDKYFANSVYPVFDAEGEKVVSIAVFSSDITERKRAEQEIIDYQQRLKALAYRLTIAEEKERGAIAVDLHDHIGQSLALARVQLASARQSASDSKLADKLDDISNTLLKTLEDTQLLMLELSSPSMDETGLSSAISEWLEGHIRDKHSLKTEVIDNIPDNRRKTLEPNVRTIIFRNVRELLVNVVKHARANKVSVRLEDRNTSIRIIVEDDGIGFEPRAVTQAGSKTGGFGLFSVEELMADLGGNLKIVSEPGKGCTAILSAPFGVDDGQERS